jgi:exonuclease SbcC
MRIDRITLRGITTYHDQQTLDLAALGPGIVAVAGPNGSGKTTLLESVPGALYRQTPSRGSIAALATARDAQIEIVGANGSPFTARLDIDAVSGKSEAVLLDGSGEPVAGPKVRDYDRAIAEHFPPLSVYLAAAFACQTGAGSLLRMDRAERRALFGRLLGLERLEQLAAGARERTRLVEQEMSAARAALDAVRSGAGDVAALETTLQAARGDAARAAGAGRDAQDRLRVATAARDRLTAALAEAQRAERAAQEAQRRAEAAAEALERLERQAEALAPILAEAPAIRAHAEALRAAEGDLAALATGCQTAEAEAKRTAKDAREARQRHDAAKAQADGLRSKLAALDAILADGPAIREQAAKLASLTADLERLRVEGEAAAAVERTAADALRRASDDCAGVRRAAENARQRNDAEAEALERARETLDRARASAKGYPCATALDAATRATCPAIRGHLQAAKAAEAELARLQDAMPEIERETEATRKAADCAIVQKTRAAEAAELARDAAAALRTRYREVHGEHEQLRGTDRSAALDRAEAEAGALRGSLETAEQTHVEAENDVRNTHADEFSAADAYHDTRAKWQTLADRTNAMRPRDRSAELQRAEIESAALGGRLEAARADAQARAAEATAAIASVQPVDMDALQCASNAATSAEILLAQAETSEAEAQRQAARLEAQLEAARAAQAKAEQLVAKVAPLERDLSDWRFLSRGLGREGVQALELDAAGPRVSDLCNELLREGYGGRFSVRLETQAAKADGKGVKETFDVVVCDNERGREGNGEDLSGGEKIIVGEALGLGVSLFHAQASGASFQTVVRDETVGALDPENAERYVAMLKSFLRIGVVHQLLFVSHSERITEMADAIVQVENGVIRVR